MAKQQQRGLGKGLSALLGEDAEAVSFRSPVRYINPGTLPGAQSEGLIREIDINNITPNPFQPRVTFDRQALDELADSIRSLGLIQPITVRKVDGGRYQIISGERRFRASKQAGLASIPAYVRETDDTGMLELAIVENVQRQDLDPIETAMSYQRLLDECHLTQEKMADRIGKNRVSVTNFLRLLKLPAKVQYDLKVGRISVGHAKVLLSLDEAALQEELCGRIVREGLSVRALEQIVRELTAAVPAEKKRAAAGAHPGLPDDFYSVAEILGKYFNNNVVVKRLSSGKGVMTIKFNDDGQMSEFLKVVKKVNL